MFGQESVVISGFDTIKQVMLEKGNDFNGRPPLFRMEQYSEKKGFMNQPSAILKSLRKATFRGIRAYGHGRTRMSHILYYISQQTMANFQESGGRPVDPWSFIYSSMLQSIVAYTLEENMKPSSNMYKLVLELDELAMEILTPCGAGTFLDVFPQLRYLNHPVWKKCLRLHAVRNKLWSLVSPIIQENFDRNEPSAISHYMLLAMEENKQIGEDHLKVAVCDMMVAGTVTTTVSSYTLVNILAHHPQLQRDLQKEVDRILGNSDSWSVDDLREMPYMKATLLELHRYLSVVPMGLPHCPVHNHADVNGYNIPKNIVVLCNLWGVHHDKEFWKDPDLFRPSRFLDENGDILPVDHEKRKRVLAFGMGPRLCPGEHFSTGRMFMLFSSLMKHFDILKDPESETQPSCDPRTFSLGLAIQPHKYRVIFAARPMPTHWCHEE